MSWKCSFKHNWVYSDETYTITSGPAAGRLSKVKGTIRICDRCFKKQRRLSAGNRPWVYISLSKSEKRDKKLKELGI